VPTETLIVGTELQAEVAMGKEDVQELRLLLQEQALAATTPHLQVFELPPSPVQGESVTFLLAAHGGDRLLHLWGILL
jgi:hypothetical protein